MYMYMYISTILKIVIVLLTQVAITQPIRSLHVLLIEIILQTDLVT